MSNVIQKLQDRDARILEIQSWTDEEQVKQHQKCMGDIINSVVEVAMIFVARVEAKRDTSYVPGWLSVYLYKLASGQMLPETFSNFEGPARRAISVLPLNEQKALAEGQRVSLVVIHEGKTEILKVKPNDMQPIQVTQVFHRGHIRSDPEQVTWIKEYCLKRLAKSTEYSEPYKVDKKKRTLIVKKPVTISRKDLLEALKEME